MSQRSSQLRLLVAILALRVHEVVTTDHLVEALWPVDRPADSRKALQIQISRLRKRLTAPVAIETLASGYRLVAGTDGLDTEAFGRLADEGCSPADLSAALELYRGPVLEDLPDLCSDPRVVLLENDYLSALSRWSEFQLEAGKSDPVVAALVGPCERHPYREALWSIRVRALAQSGRAADALDLHREVVARFVADLGAPPADDFLAIEGTLLAGTNTTFDDLAARVAVATQAFSGSVAPLRRSLAALSLEPSAGRFDALYALGRVLRAAGEPEHRDRLREAVVVARSIDDTDRELKAVTALRPVGWLSSLGTPDEDYREILRTTLERTESLDDDRRAVVLADLAGSLLHSDDAEKRIALFEEALARARRSGSTSVLRRVLANALVLDERDRLADRLVLGAELVLLGQEADDLEAVHLGAAQVCLAALEAGRADLIDHHLELARTTAEQVGHRSSRWLATSLEATVASLRGRYDDAERLANEALELGLGTGMTEAWAVAMFAGQLFELRLMQGRDDGLGEAAAAMAENQPHYPPWEAGVLLMEASLAPSPATTAKLEAAIDARAPFDVGLGWSSEAVAFMQAAFVVDRTDLAVAVGEMCSEYADRWIYSGSASSGPLCHFLARAAKAAGDDRRAIELFERARQSCVEMEAPGYLALVEVELAALSNDPDDAIKLLRSAKKRAEEIGARALLRDLEAQGL